jgi:1-deoxy-D-xylulose-5-phosphate synthase
MRPFPNLIMMAPADGLEVEPMLRFALNQNIATAIRYPKASAAPIERNRQPIELGKSETVQWGTDGAIIACGAMLRQALQAAAKLAEQGLEVAVINARFIKPLDQTMLQKVFEECRFVLTVEEGQLAGGFGSAVLEHACKNGWDTRTLRTLGISDRYVEHAERDELLADLGLDDDGIVRAALALMAKLPAAAHVQS